MRLVFGGLLFLLLLLASITGVGASFGDFLLALLFYVGIVGLVVVGLVSLVHAVRFGGRGAYGQPAVTLRGELVRSRSEKAIADWFYRNGVRYVYEYPAFDSRGRRVGVPDFYLPDFDVYVEYWGLAGADRGYDKRMARKTERYFRNGVRVVSLYPGDLHDLGSALGSRLGQGRGPWPGRNTSVSVGT